MSSFKINKDTSKKSNKAYRKSCRALFTVKQKSERLYILGAMKKKDICNFSNDFGLLAQRGI